MLAWDCDWALLSAMKSAEIHHHIIIIAILTRCTYAAMIVVLPDTVAHTLVAATDAKQVSN